MKNDLLGVAAVALAVASFIAGHSCVVPKENPLARPVELHCIGVSDTLGHISDAYEKYQKYIALNLSPDQLARATSMFEMDAMGGMDERARAAFASSMKEISSFCASVRQQPHEKTLKYSDQIFILASNYREARDLSVAAQKVAEMHALFDQINDLPLDQ